MGVKLKGTPLIEAELGPDGEAILWPKPRRGQRLPISYEAIETIMSRSIDLLGLTSYTGLAMAMGFSRSMGGYWLRHPERPPSRAAIIRLLYLFCLHKQDAARWSGTDLFLIDWDNVHFYGIPYTPYATAGTALPLDGGEVWTSRTPLFRSRHPRRKGTNWPQFETVITWTIHYLRLRSLVGLGKAINFSQPVVDGWLVPPKRGPSPLALWKMAYLWILHFDNPHKWVGVALRSVDWRNIHTYGVPYQPYSPYNSDEDTEEVRRFLKQRQATQQQQAGLLITPIVKTKPEEQR